MLNGNLHWGSSGGQETVSLNSNKLFACNSWASREKKLSPLQKWFQGMGIFENKNVKVEKNNIKYVWMEQNNIINSLD